MRHEALGTPGASGVKRVNRRSPGDCNPRFEMGHIFKANRVGRGDPRNIYGRVIGTCPRQVSLPPEHRNEKGDWKLSYAVIPYWKL